MVRRTEAEIQKVDTEIAKNRKEQTSRFQAMSVEDQRRMCAIVGLEHLEGACSTANETLPAADALATSDRSLVMPANVRSEEVSKQAERAGGVVNLFQPTDIQANLSLNENKTTRGHGAEQADRQWEGGNIIQIPHKRVEALRGFPVPQSSPYTSRPLPQQAPWSRNVAQSQVGSQTQPSQWPGTADIDELLRQNRERQRSLFAELMMSKADILQMQEDIRRTEEVEGRILPKVNIDLEAFLGARDVGWVEGEGGDENEHGV